MARVAHIVGEGGERLWGLAPRTRLERLLRAAGVDESCSELGALAATDEVLLLDAAYLFEVRTLGGLLAVPGHALFAPGEARPAAAFVDASQAMAVLAAMRQGAELPAGIGRLEPDALESYDRNLRKAEPPLLERVTAANRAALESRLYGNAYKGITDLVTKWLWPRPARVVVGWCARLGITPNMVTVGGLLLVIAASLLFQHGHYASGLTCGWIMTLLDTVDGKLARVTIQSSRFGHWLDHGMDIVHPPIWYVLWGAGLAAGTRPLGLDLATLDLLVVSGYVAGRAIEAAFHALGHCGLFAWRPFDAYFRLVTARRNPCLIILTVLLPLAGPAAAIAGVALWTILTSAVLLLRLCYALLVRLRSGPLDSWLKDPARAAREHARAYRTFAGTRGAYG